MDALFNMIPVVVGAIVLLCIVAGIATSMYKTVGANRAMVIVGPGGNKIVTGKGAFIIPFLQTVDYMPLENIQSDFTSRDEIPTKDAINILVDAVANVSISKDPELMKIAATKFVGKNIAYICEIITPVLEGNIREVISQFTLKELIQGDKKVFAEKVIENVVPNLHDMGLELDTFNIQNFKDRNGIIENLGIENIAQIEKDAKIAKYDAERAMAIAQAKAKKEANDAQVVADLQIANTIAEANKQNEQII